MGTSGSLAADLAVLTSVLDEPDVDLEAHLDAVTAAARLAVASYVGMRMAIAVDGQHVSFTTHNRDAPAIASSLLIPLHAVLNASAGSTLTLYAATRGAFVDLAADLCYALDVHHTALVLDDDLSPRHRSGVTGLAERREINQAIGVLLERGHSTESAREELHRLAGPRASSLDTAAERVLHSPMGHPDHDDRATPADGDGEIN